jgi:hypothetical protein
MTRWPIHNEARWLAVFACDTVGDNSSLLHSDRRLVFTVIWQCYCRPMYNLCCIPQEQCNWIPWLCVLTLSCWLFTDLRLTVGKKTSVLLFGGKLASFFSKFRAPDNSPLVAPVVLGATLCVPRHSPDGSTTSVYFSEWVHWIRVVFWCVNTYYRCMLLFTSM